jgi:hypothetical protein
VKFIKEPVDYLECSNLIVARSRARGCPGEPFRLLPLIRVLRHVLLPNQCLPMRWSPVPIHPVSIPGCFLEASLRNGF